MMTKAKAAAILRKAATRVDRGWTQGANALDQAGIPCQPTSEKARTWCVRGAILAETRYNSEYCQTFTMHAFQLYLGKKEKADMNLPFWNDHSHRQQHHVSNALRACADELESS